MPCRTPDQPPEHIPAAFVARHNAVGYHKRRRTDMVGNQTDRNIVCHIRLIRLTCQPADFIADSFHRINIKHGIYVLHNDCQTL